VIASVIIVIASVIIAIASVTIVIAFAIRLARGVLAGVDAPNLSGAG
jgi:hypothetical protein